MAGGAVGGASPGMDLSFADEMKFWPAGYTTMGCMFQGVAFRVQVWALYENVAIYIKGRDSVRLPL